MSTPSSPPATMASARSLALYGLCLCSGAGAVLAWPGPSGSTLGLLAATLGLAAAQILGEGLAPWLGGAVGPRTRTRIRLWAGVLYTGTAVLVLAVVSLEPKLLHSASEFLLLLQGLFLVGLEVLGGPVLAVANALVLVFLTAFRGGLPAAASVIGFLGLLVFFLTFDNFTRQLSSHPTPQVSLTGAAVGEAARMAGPLVLGLAIFFAAYPPAPYSHLPFGPETTAPLPEQVEEAYRRLLLLALGGGASVLLATRLMRWQPKSEPVREELVEPERSPEETLPPPPRRRRLYAGARGRIVRAYLHVLEQGSRLGLRLKASLTPTQIAAQLGKPPVPVATLTTLFVQARYGPQEPTDADAGAAEAAARLILSRRRAPPARGPGRDSRG